MSVVVLMVFLSQRVILEIGGHHLISTVAWEQVIVIVHDLMTFSSQTVIPERDGYHLSVVLALEQVILTVIELRISLLHRETLEMSAIVVWGLVFVVLQPLLFHQETHEIGGYLQVIATGEMMMTGKHVQVLS